jgi:hypothetical protein
MSRIFFDSHEQSVPARNAGLCSIESWKKKPFKLLEKSNAGDPK